MADNFDMKKFLVENKLGAYSRLKEDRFYSRDYVAQKYGDKAKEIETNIEDEEDNNPNVWDLYTSLETPQEVDDFVKGYMNEGEAAYEYEKGKAAGEKIEKEKLAKEDMGHDIEDAEAEKMMDFLAEEPDQAKVQDLYDKITAVIAKAAKKLSDDDASALHDKLKAFFNKLLETKKQVKEALDVRKVQSADDKLRMLISNISTNSNIPTADKEGLLSALSELQDFVDEVGYDVEMEDDEPVSDYSRRRQSGLDENLLPQHQQLIQNIVDNYFDGGIEAEAAMIRIEKILNGDVSDEETENEELNEASNNPEGDKLVLRFLQGIAKKFDYPVAQAAMFVKERIKSLGY